MLPLMEIIPRVTPTMLGKPTIEPRHLAPYVDTLDGMLGSHAELAFAAPPQHGKTEVTKHALAKWLATSNDGRFYYVTFSQRRADSVALDFWYLAERCGLRPLGRRDHWTSGVTGSRILFTSIGGPITGESAPENGVIVVDDPIKDRVDGMSRAKKEAAWGWLYGSMLSRRHPGSSAVCMSTRWATDDPVGRLVGEWGWKYINLQAICEDERDPLGRQLGEPLWPKERPLEFLEERRQRDPWGFAAMYQGLPVPRGAEFFPRQVSRFRHLPDGPFIVGYGGDLAFTAKTSADWSRVLRAYRFGQDVYFTAGIGAQLSAPEFTPAIKSFVSSPSGPLRWYIGGGGEKGVAQFIVQRVPALQAIPATSDKMARATPLAEAWAAERVHFPEEGSEHWAPWVDDCLGEMMLFTGVNDQHDDWVDAAAAAFDQVMVGSSAPVDGFGGVAGSRWGSGYGYDDEDEDEDV